jgi:hypothetical protein
LTDPDGVPELFHWISQCSGPRAGGLQRFPHVRRVRARFVVRGRTRTG